MPGLLPDIDPDGLLEFSVVCITPAKRLDMWLSARSV